MTNGLYVLQKNTVDAHYEGFGLSVEAPSVIGRKRLLDDMAPGYGLADDNPRWEQVSLSDHWVAPKVRGNVDPTNDFPCINLHFPAFSAGAVAALGDTLTNNGELLALDTNVGNYYFYNITTISDALDHEESECEFWCDPPTTADHISYFSFDKLRLDGLSIFRIYEDPAHIIVTEEFKELVKFKGLKGFEYKKIWPLNRSQNWFKGERLH